MTITFTIPFLSLQGGLSEAIRSLLPVVEPIVLAIAGACGAGLLAQIGLDIGLKLARHALSG